MQFPFETTTKDGRKATVLGAMPDGRLLGYLTREDNTFDSREWDASGSAYFDGASITLPLQIKPLTTYRMRGGGIAWTSRVVDVGWIDGMTADGDRRSWRVADGRRCSEGEGPLDLIEELPPGTTE